MCRLSCILQIFNVNTSLKTTELDYLEVGGV